MRRAHGVPRPPGHVPASLQSPCRNRIWDKYLRNLGRGCNSRRSLRPDSGLAWPAGILPRSTGGRPNADDSVQSDAAQRRSHRPKPAFRKVILDGDRRSDGRYLEISATPCPEGATLDWGWPPTYGSGPFALATPCTHVPGRYSGPSKFKSRVAHPWSWDIGSSTSAAWTSLNMVLSCRKARPFGLSTKLGLQESGRPSPKGTALWPEPCSMD